MATTCNISVRWAWILSCPTASAATFRYAQCSWLTLNSHLHLSSGCDTSPRPTRISSNSFECEVASIRFPTYRQTSWRRRCDMYVMIRKGLCCREDLKEAGLSRQSGWSIAWLKEVWRELISSFWQQLTVAARITVLVVNCHKTLHWSLTQAEWKNCHGRHCRAQWRDEDE